MESDRVFVAGSIAAKDVECRSDGEVHSSLAKLRHPPQIVHRPCAAGVRCRNRQVPRDQPNQRFVDALAKPLDVDSMNEEFVTMFGELAESAREVNFCQRSVTTK